MKTNYASLMKLTLTLIAAAAIGVLLGTLKAQAHDGQWDSRHHYYRNNYGYWDNHDHYRHYETWNGHHGYWDDRGGSRVFISVGL